MTGLQKSNIKTFLEASGGIVVLLGLIFVGLELRQNTAAVQAATFQDLTHVSSAFLVGIASDAEVSRIYRSGRQDPSLLSPDERNRYYLIQQAFWLRMQNVFMQWQRGTLTDDDWIVYQAVICGSATAPGPENHWRSANALTASFKEILESCSNK